MPEGPEVCAVADCLRPLFTGGTLRAIVHDERAVFINGMYATFPAVIERIQTYGKKLLFVTQDYVLVFSLGMSGRLTYEPAKHSHIKLQFSWPARKHVRIAPDTLYLPGMERRGDQVYTSLFFDDQRYFGNLQVVPRQEMDVYMSRFGPDLLAAAMTTEIPLATWLPIFVTTRRKRCNIGAFLMDQSVLAGIGNYLKSEILYVAHIRPDRTVGSLQNAEILALREAAHHVIRRSYMHGGFTLHSFITPNGKQGLYPPLVYGQSVDPHGYPVQSGRTKDGRTSYWVEELQE